MKKKTEKPEVRIVVMNDGSIRIIGAQCAARFCGVKPQSFSACIRRHYAAFRRGGRTAAKIPASVKVRSAYPELFR